jgi:hypothetical protein
MNWGISSSDKTYASRVKAYRFQENPLDAGVYLWVTTGDPENPNDRDARVGLEDMETLGMRLPMGEVGGGHLWWRKGKVEIGCYFIKDRLEQDIAGDYAHTVLGRAMHNTERTVVSDLVDTFGEKALYLYIYASTYFESGGPPKMYIWRGDVYWQVLTERPM